MWQKCTRDVLWVSNGITSHSVTKVYERCSAGQQRHHITQCDKSVREMFCGSATASHHTVWQNYMRDVLLFINSITSQCDKSVQEMFCCSLTPSHHSVTKVYKRCSAVGGGVDPIPCVSTHRISDPRSGPAQLLPPHVKQRSHPHGVRPQIPDR